MLKVEGINVSYGDVRVLWDVSFTVNEGELIALLGANGAKKTTALNTISGLLRPRSGRIFFFSGVDITKVPNYKVAEFGIAHVPEGRRFFPRNDGKGKSGDGSFAAGGEKKEKRDHGVDIQPLPNSQGKAAAGSRNIKRRSAADARHRQGPDGAAETSHAGRAVFGPGSGCGQPGFRHYPGDQQKRNHRLLVEQNVRHVLTMCTRAYVLENGRVVLEGSGTELLDNRHIKEAYLGI